MPSRETFKAVRLPEDARKSALPERGRTTFGDVIAEKLLGGTVSTFDVKRSLKLARDTTLASEDRIKIIDALRVPNREVLPHDWANAILGNIAKKDKDPEVKRAAENTLFFRKKGAF